MVHLGALGASVLGRFASFNRSRLRLIVACGAAAGVAAAYGAPIAGALFVAEIVLGTMAIHTVGPLLLAAAVSSFTVNALGGHLVSYTLPSVPSFGIEAMLPILVLGIVAGFGAPYFLKFLDLFRGAFKKTGWPEPWRLGTGGLLLGVILIFMPVVAGNGYNVVASLLGASWPWHAVLLVLLMKLLATALTVGSGAVGGVFTPTLFMGAVVGTLFGQVLEWTLPGFALPLFLYAAVGMGAFLAAGTGAPLMAILMVFEMTRSYALVLPLMPACVLAYFVARAVAQVAMYDVTLVRERDTNLRNRLRDTLIGDLIKPAVTVVATATPVKVVLQRFSEYPVRYWYVVDEDSIFQGVIAQQDITTLLLGRGDIEDKTAGDILRLDFVKPLHPDMSLDAAQDIFVNFTGERVPVVSHGDAPKLLGVVYKSDLLEKYFALKKSLDSGGDSVHI
jgi:CIC family chloride channel protein